MNKLIMMSFLAVFWLTFPLAMTLQHSSCFTQPIIDQYNSLTEPTAWDALGGLWSYLKIMFQFIFIGIPCAPPYIRIITFTMSVITGFALYLFIRGD